MRPRKLIFMTVLAAGLAGCVFDTRTERVGKIEFNGRHNTVEYVYEVDAVTGEQRGISYFVDIDGQRYKCPELSLQSCRDTVRRIVSVPAKPTPLLVPQPSNTTAGFD